MLYFLNYNIFKRDFFQRNLIQRFFIDLQSLFSYNDRCDRYHFQWRSHSSVILILRSSSILGGLLWNTLPFNVSPNKKSRRFRMCETLNSLLNPIRIQIFLGCNGFVRQWLTCNPVVSAGISVESKICLIWSEDVRQNDCVVQKPYWKFEVDWMFWIWPHHIQFSLHFTSCWRLQGKRLCW